MTSCYTARKGMIGILIEEDTGKTKQSNEVTNTQVIQGK